MKTEDKIKMKKVITSLLSILLIPLAKAHCPVCTIGAGAAAAGAVWLGISKVIVALFIGAFAMSMGMWFSRVIKKKYLRYQKTLIIVVVFLTTVLPLNLGNGWCFAKSDGIKLENTQKVTLRGNVLIENERHGLDLRESKEIDVTRNSFVKNGTYAIFAASSYFQSTNNTFHANTSMVHEQDEPAPEAMRVF